MKRFYPLFLSILLCACTINAHAQMKMPGVLIGAGLLYQSPKGLLANNYKSGIGGEVMGGLGWGKTYLTVSYGSARFLSKPGYKDIIIKPIKVGVRQYMLGKKLFVGAEMGNAAVRDKTNQTETSNFTYGLGGGVRLMGIEAGMYYNGWNQGSNNSFHFMQYKVGYNIML